MDLNVMMAEQARNGLQTQLDAAVTNGDTEAARKITDELSKLAVQTAPKTPPYGDAEIRAELNKLEWFGTDPKKTGRVLALGKDMDPKKFATAALFAGALVKAVDDEFKPAAGEGEEEPGGGEEEPGEGDTGKEKPAPRTRRSDAPGEGDTGNARPVRRASGPWEKMTDAPADVQAAIKKSADKFVPSNAPKEQREKYISSALASHFNAHQQRNKGKK